MSLDQGQCFYSIRIKPEDSRSTELYINNLLVEPDGAATIIHVTGSEHDLDTVRPSAVRCASERSVPRGAATIHSPCSRVHVLWKWRQERWPCCTHSHWGQPAVIRAQFSHWTGRAASALGARMGSWAPLVMRRAVPRDAVLCHRISLCNRRCNRRRVRVGCLRCTLARQRSCWPPSPACI